MWYASSFQIIRWFLSLITSLIRITIQEIPLIAWHLRLSKKLPSMVVAFIFVRKFHKNFRIVEYCAYVWTQNRKCIKMSTNKPMFGLVVLIACDIFINKGSSHWSLQLVWWVLLKSVQYIWHKFCVRRASRVCQLLSKSRINWIWLVLSI